MFRLTVFILLYTTVAAGINESYSVFTQQKTSMAHDYCQTMDYNARTYVFFYIICIILA